MRCLSSYSGAAAASLLLFLCSCLLAHLCDARQATPQQQQLSSLVAAEQPLVGRRKSKGENSETGSKSLSPRLALSFSHVALSLSLSPQLTTPPI